MKFNFSKAAIAATLLMSFAGANAIAQVADPFGVPANNAMPEREIAMNSSTKYVNVNQGEIVKFVSNGKSFTWKFDTFGMRPFSFSKIAPQNFEGGNATVYLGTNPLYRGH
ncbi:CzcE family metal-binding protein [Herbaspirillum huttiense]|uniref:CzcE family metal-binding protein n=1 Tax=Herbaspirillum huttiense TaxID=863372 RepID=UPI000408B6B5|nr:CzcE family metal-binding protein [Herbaspirillum huttiense]